MRVAALITGIIGSLVNAIVALLMIVFAFAAESIFDLGGGLEDLTDVDNVIIVVLVIIAIIFLIAAVLGILGASLAIAKPTGAFVMLVIATVMTLIFLIIALFTGVWQIFLPFLLSTILLVASCVLTLLGRRELQNTRY